MAGETAPAAASLLEVKELKKHFPIRSGLLSLLKGFIRALDGVTFELEHGKTLGIVGESGSGKSTLARTIARLIDPTGGSVVLLGQPMTELHGKKLRKFRVNFQMVFQDPISSLNPRKLAIDIIGEPLKIHFKLHGEELTREVADLMAKVGLEKPQLYRYPHEFSGGQRQRVALMRGLMADPDALLLDEPLGALDLKLRKELQVELRSLQRRLGITFVFVTHDQEEALALSDRIAVNSPSPATTIDSRTFTLSGAARTFEANVVWRLKDSTQKVVANGHTAASLGTSALWGTFSTPVTLPTGVSGNMTLEVYEVSPKDGSEQGVVAIPLLVR